MIPCVFFIEKTTGWEAMYPRVADTDHSPSAPAPSASSQYLMDEHYLFEESKDMLSLL